MRVFKGDTVRTSTGYTGEITEIWGIARTFCRIRQECGRTVPVMEKDVTEILQRADQRKEMKSGKKKGHAS